MNVIELVNRITGMAIERVIAGGSNGSIIILKVGNDEFSIRIQCVWRLQQNGRVIAGWSDSNDALTGNLTIQAKALKGSLILKIEVAQLYDLKLYFSGDKVLEVFCDVTPNYEPESYDENWVISDIRQDISYVANKYYEIITRPYGVSSI